MEIRDPVHGSIVLSDNEATITEQFFFQRLRNIKQMGFTEFGFPGATHNRYCHSVGAMHLAGQAFDSIFSREKILSPDKRTIYRQVVRLAALLHDVGHGPLSHTTEEVMPPLHALKVPLYVGKRNRRANHEDYTIKIITDSNLTEVLAKSFPDFSPRHIAMLIDKEIPEQDDFFVVGGLDVRTLLSQIVSSELDVDRMDYLSRDSYYCGTSYGQVDYSWLIANLRAFNNEGRLHLALNRRALYTFDDFLLSRYHMYLMVYFHHKGVVYDEMMLKYMKSKDCDFFLPSDLDQYLKCDDYFLYTHMAQSPNRWAQLISQRQPYRMVFESHEQKTTRADELEATLKAQEIECIRTRSTGRLSKYYYSGSHTGGYPIFVVDGESMGSEDAKPDAVKLGKATKIEKSTQVFDKYQDARQIDRIYVSPKDFRRSQRLVRS
jgi:uncharacterized protein